MKICRLFSLYLDGIFLSTDSLLVVKCIFQVWREFLTTYLVHVPPFLPFVLKVSEVDVFLGLVIFSFH